MKKILLLLPILFLVACTGSGMDSVLLLQEINTDETQVFVKRDTGFAVPPALVRVTLNGNSIGELGNGERISAIAKGDTGVVSANFTSIASYLSSSDTKKFNINKGEKLFFVIKQEFGMMLPKISINQTDKNDFFSN
jgi:hypothetical protein|tara:strand:- start:207 stop:617 length:411 start_codon:yes stop_codon:yes gene_type:complete